MTYGADGIYGHPDHIKAHEVTVAALDLMDAEGWQPTKAYFVCISQGGMKRMGEMLREMGREDLLQQESRIQGVPDEDVTTVIDTSQYAELKRRAFGEHRSQNDPNSPFLSMQGKIFDAMMSTETYVLARGALGEEKPERDLFSGIPN